MGTVWGTLKKRIHAVEYLIVLLIFLILKKKKTSNVFSVEPPRVRSSESVLRSARRPPTPPPAENNIRRHTAAWRAAVARSRTQPHLRPSWPFPVGMGSSVSVMTVVVSRCALPPLWVKNLGRWSLFSGQTLDGDEYVRQPPSHQGTYVGRYTQTDRQ